MEKKRVFSKSLILLAITSIMLFAMSITSMAATNQTMNVRQTGGDESEITLEWSSRLGYDHYDVEFSQDGVNWEYMEDTSSPKVTIYKNLSTGSTYYARIKAYKQGHILGDHDESTALVSETISVCTAPTMPTDLKQTAATKNSVTLSWTAVPGATGYEIYRLNESYNWDKIATSNTNSVKLTGLKASSGFKYSVASVKNVQTCSVVGNRTDSVVGKTTPSKVKNIDMTYFWGSLKECEYEWTSVNNADGYQYEVRKATGKKVYDKKATIFSYTYFKPYPQGTFIKARVRAYITVNGKKVYGSWSDYTYSGVSKSVTAKRSKNGKKIYLNWKKVSGVSEYRIYISTSPDKGFKKVATVSSKKAAKYTITKYNKKNLKKGKKYYVRLRYVSKVGNKKKVGTVYSQAEIN